jgi:3-deoxy-D-manno-octulosonate 8-phosphate phosphatase (KDO 8-P phosphatase)
VGGRGSSLPVSEDLLERARHVNLVSFDVDGVLTDGRIVYSDHGSEIKAFHVQDGSAIKLLASCGITVALITGRSSSIVDRRAAELGIEHVHQGVKDKAVVFGELLQSLRLPAAAAAHVGDDLPDLPVFAVAGLAIGVPNGHPATLARVHYVTQVAGGQGVAREVCELLLRAREQWPHD